MRSIKLGFIASVFSMAFAQDSAVHMDCCSVPGFLPNDPVTDMAEPTQDKKEWDVNEKPRPYKND